MPTGARVTGRSSLSRRTSKYAAFSVFPPELLGHGLDDVLIFDGLTPTEASDLVSQHGVEVGDSNGHVVNPATDPEDTAAAIAQKCVTAHVAAAEFTTTRESADADELSPGDAPLVPITARAAAVEVSVSRNVEAGVNAHIGLGTRYRHRITLAPASGADRSALTRPAMAQVWARQIATEVIKLNDRTEVDLFLATTVDWRP